MAPNRKRRSYIRRFRDSSLFFIILVIERQIIVIIIAICVNFEVGIVVVIQQDVIVIIVDTLLVEAGRNLGWCVAVLVVFGCAFQDHFFFVAAKLLGSFLVDFIILVVVIICACG
mmetsp:Transcript_11936/g.30967  ORF Transcript_11936/g.30967 Transcript_11936/m.30967 type:complete len:115 (-) Transcript_11936:234-578(-)